MTNPWYIPPIRKPRQYMSQFVLRNKLLDTRPSQYLVWDSPRLGTYVKKKQGNHPRIA